MMMHAGLSRFGVKLPGIRSAWSPLIDHIMDQRQKYGFEAAAILSDSAGYLHDSTKHFIPSELEVKVSVGPIGTVRSTKRIKPCPHWRL